MFASPDGLVVVLPDALVDELVERVAARLARPAAEPWVGVGAVAAHLGCGRQRIYDLVSQRGRRGDGIPHRKDGSRLLFRLSEIDAWLTPPRR
jgi:predicted DNA-binding transcriptional regulator AlpA